MEPRLSEVRRAIAALGKRGRTTALPARVREQVLAYAQGERCRGRSWRAIAQAVGVSASALQRWSQAKPKRGSAGVVPVRVVADPAVEVMTVSLVSPQGYRIEGMRLDQALRALAQLR